MALPKNSKAPTRTSARSAPSESKKQDYLQVSRAVLYAGRFLGPNHVLSNPRHRLLLLVLESRRFRRRPIRAFWRDLGRDLGVAPGTVRKWAYALRDAKLLGITNHKGRVRGPDDSLHWRDDRNTFSLKPFWDFAAAELEPKRLAERNRRRKAVEEEAE